MRGNKYAADGLTLNWYASQPSVPDNWEDWWSDNYTKPRGVSYCIVNSQRSKHTDELTYDLSRLTTGSPFEILEFTDEKRTMKELFPKVKYSHVQRISDDSYETREGY